ncbi:gna-3 g alpha subunit gna-3 [Fusarium sporotrichioides]|uniref:Gna-3 g alpha subunit gna-3 n=1 Tax=Fusarium sporotrichioides TaxID=5514 RepID=A0A395S6E8_FUSSP|nr:gna-3 g alpha subunit gna-3 [Fusarium sporotrichioides]
MADPITILGTAGAVANIVDVLGKVINTVAELRSQWQDADLAVLNLESQLGALNTALNKIMAWTESAFNSPHHQLVMDLDRCVFCCRTLINRIATEISQFQMTAENRLDALSKFRLLLKTKDFENIQRMIEQQTGALTLLLTATNTLFGNVLPWHLDKLVEKIDRLRLRPGTFYITDIQKMDEWISKEKSSQATKLKVFEIVCESAKALVNAMQQFQITPEVNEIQEHLDLIAAFVPDSNPVFDPNFKAALGTLLGSRHYPELMLRRTEISLPESAE